MSKLVTNWLKVAKEFNTRQMRKSPASHPSSQGVNELLPTYMSVIKSGDNAKTDQEKAKFIDILPASKLRKKCASDQMPKDYWTNLRMSGLMKNTCGGQMLPHLIKNRAI